MYFCTMLKNKFLILLGIVGMMVFVSCSKHTQILKSTDNEYKYNAAMYYYGQNDYNRALQLFDVLQSAYRGKPQGETDRCFCNTQPSHREESHQIRDERAKVHPPHYPDDLRDLFLE